MMKSFITSALMLLATLTNHALAQTTAQNISEISCEQTYKDPWNLRLDLRQRYDSWQEAEVKTIYGLEYRYPQVLQIVFSPIVSVTETTDNQQKTLSIIGRDLYLTIDMTHDLSKVVNGQTVMKDWYLAKVNVNLAKNKDGEFYLEERILCYVK